MLYRGVEMVVRRLGLLAVVGTLACGEDEPAQGKYEMYVDDAGLSTTELTFLKGTTCAQVRIDAKDATARSTLIEFSEALAESIPIDGSKPADDQELLQLVPSAASLSEWSEDTSGDPTEGPKLISTTAYAWANGASGPFDDHGFEAVALEYYGHSTQAWSLSVALVYMSDVAGADAAFHYRDAGAPDQPYWDKGEQLH